MLVYSEINSPRLQYVLREIFRRRLGIEFELTSYQDAWNEFSGAKMSYSRIQKADLHILPAGLLEEKDIDINFKPSFKRLEGSAIPLLFREKGGSFDFDLFSAVFYLLSRYEEYQPAERDQFGRFPSKESMIRQAGLLEIPMVDIWLNILRDKIHDVFPSLQIASPKYQFQSTIDIDNAFAYLHKGFIRKAGGYAEDIVKGRLENLKIRHAVNIGRKRDPYDSFDELNELHERYQVRPQYFVLLADYAENDKNLSHRHPAFRALLKELAQKADMGIHPGFQSNRITENIVREKQRLEEIIDNKVEKSRQHYLMLTLPGTYRNLLAAGIREDHSMGFADQVGFRAGTSIPFQFYDLSKEEETALKVVPFCAMDASLNRYMGLSPEQAIEKLSALRDEIRKHQGHFVTLWHNETLSEMREWKSWRAVYEKLLKIGKEID